VLAGRFRDPTDQQFKVVDNETGHMAAFIRWIVPEGMKGMAAGFNTYEERSDAESVEMEDKLLKKGPAGSNEALFYEFFLTTKNMNEKWEATKKLGKSAFRVKLFLFLLFSCFSEAWPLVPKGLSEICH
jgi:hypothetical protein